MLCVCTRVRCITLSNAVRPLDPNRIALSREEGAISVDADGRLGVTKDGFAVLDAVVADLAA